MNSSSLIFPNSKDVFNFKSFSNRRLRTTKYGIQVTSVGGGGPGGDHIKKYNGIQSPAPKQLILDTTGKLSMHAKSCIDLAAEICL